LLIELAASVKLMPTNYALKLYGYFDENNNALNSKNEEERIIEYTPNQTIGQLSMFEH
jgi:hypothetical protein